MNLSCRTLLACCGGWSVLPIDSRCDFFNYKFDPNSCKVVLPRHLTRASPHATWFLCEASQSRQLRRNCQLCGSHYHSCSASSVCVCLIGASLASLQVFGIFSPNPLVTQRLGSLHPGSTRALAMQKMLSDFGGCENSTDKRAACWAAETVVRLCAC